MPAMLNFLKILTVLGQVIIIGIVLLLIIKLVTKSKAGGRLLAFINSHAPLAALGVSLIATLGSLYLSDILHWLPCRLCWYQRIFMYPQVVLLAVALLFKDKKVWRYIIPLSVIGGAIAIYQYIIQLVPNETAICSIDAPEACSQILVLFYGYITIPLMAFTAFLLNFILGALALRNNK